MKAERFALLFMVVLVIGLPLAVVLTRSNSDAIEIQRHIPGWRGRDRFCRRPRHFDGAAHAPVIRPAPARAVKRVLARLIEDQRGGRPLAGQHIDRWQGTLPHGETMHHIIRRQAQIQGLTRLGCKVTRRPAAVIGYLRVDLCRV